MKNWPWLLRALWNPVDALDLRDKADQPDHAKIVPWILLMISIVFHAVGIPFTWWELTTLGSLAYGYGAWRTFLQAKNVTGNFASSITHTITEKRDPAAGIQPTKD
jgi:hypothetical protein